MNKLPVAIPGYGRGPSQDDPNKGQPKPLLDPEPNYNNFSMNPNVGSSVEPRVTVQRTEMDVQPPETYLRENIVSIGGPYYNPWTRRLMRECRSPLVFDLSLSDIPMINQTKSEEHRVQRSGNRIVRDYGFVARLRNPLNADKHIMMICGIETYGVLGAARLLTRTNANVHFLRLHEHLVQKLAKADGDLADFFLFSTFEVNQQGITTLDTFEIQTSGLTSRWQELEKLRLQEPPPPEDT